MKKVLFSALICCMLLYAAGCMQDAAGSTQSADGAASGTVTLSPAAAPSPTMESTPAPTSGADAELLLAPDVEGTQKDVQEKGGLQRVVYLAEAGNPYGLAEGGYAGEYKKNVLLDGTETGGVALVGVVAEKLLNDALAAIPAGEPRIKVALPMDIAEAGGDAVTIESINDALWLSCDTALMVRWIVPGSEILYVGALPDGRDAISDVRNSQLDDDSSDGSYDIAAYLPLESGERYELANNPMTNDNMIEFLQLYIENGIVSSTYGSEFRGFGYVRTGDAIPNLFGHSAYDDATGVAQKVYVVCGELQGGNLYSLTPEDILTVGGVPVFLTSAE